MSLPEDETPTPPEAEAAEAPAAPEAAAADDNVVEEAPAKADAHLEKVYDDPKEQANYEAREAAADDVFATPSDDVGHDSDDDDDDDRFGDLIDDLPEGDAEEAATQAPTDDERKADEHVEGEAAAEDHAIPLEQIDDDALWVVRRLRAKGYEAYLTGGCVRDLLLGRSPKDFDVATAATPNEVRSVFRNCRLVGRRFRLAHVFFPGGKVIETATFRANPLEVAEEEELPEDLLVERDNVWGDVEQDARRRDLTINGLFYDPVGGKVLDYVDGIKDLEARTIRTIGDPQIRFREDPVRILRVVKFATRLGFDVEAETLQAMKDTVGELTRCAQARLQEEMVRLFASSHAEECLKLMEVVGVEAVLFPEVRASLDLDLEPLPPPEPPAVEPPADDVKAEAKAEDVAADEAKAEEAPAEEAKAEEAPADEAKAEEAKAEDAPADEGTAEDAPSDEVKAEGDADASEDASGDAETAAADGEGEGEGDRRGRRRRRRGRRGNKGEGEAEAAPVGVPAPVLVLPTKEERNARFTSLVKALDEVRSRDADVSTAVVLSTLFLAGYEAVTASTEDEEAWLDKVCDQWTERMRMTRRDREGMRVLLNHLPLFRPGQRHGAAARNMVQRPWFKEALLLFTISEFAKGNDLGDVAKWKAIAAHYSADYRQSRPGEREPRPRRNRRRSSSNRRRRGR